MQFPGEMCDESELLHEMEAEWRHSASYASPRPADAGVFAALAARDLEFPGYPNGELVYGPLREMAREKGVRVLLAGYGGDEWLTGDCYHYADYLEQGDLGKLWRQWRADMWEAPQDRRLASVIMPSLPVLRFGVMPLLPKGAAPGNFVTSRMDPREHMCAGP